MEVFGKAQATRAIGKERLVCPSLLDYADFLNQLAERINARAPLAGTADNPPLPFPEFTAKRLSEAETACRLRQSIEGYVLAKAPAPASATPPNTTPKINPDAPDAWV